MSNTKRRCRSCKSYKAVSDGYLSPNNAFFCSLSAALKYNKPKQQKILVKITREKTAIKKKGLITRSKWLSKLQSVVNQYIVHVRDKDSPCFTCGTSSHNIKYDCGHYIHAGRGGADRRRFLEINLHKQCSVICNQHGGGMPEIYAAKIADVYGPDKLDWLKCETNHPALKELFPHWSDIEKEIARYRQLLRDNGIIPRV